MTVLMHLFILLETWAIYLRVAQFARLNSLTSMFSKMTHLPHASNLNVFASGLLRSQHSPRCQHVLNSSTCLDRIPYLSLRHISTAEFQGGIRMCARLESYQTLVSPCCRSGGTSVQPKQQCAWVAECAIVTSVWCSYKVRLSVARSARSRAVTRRFFSS